MNFNHRKLLLEKRSTILRSTRNFFESQQFLEVETPLLVKSPGLEPNLSAFKTEYITYSQQHIPYYLPTSPEFAMKRLLAEGFDKIFQICKCFRNDGELAPSHQPEFTMIEWYRTHSDYLQIMTDVEKLFQHYVHTLDFLSDHLTQYLSKPFERISVQNAFLNYTGIDLEQYPTRSELFSIASLQINTINESDTWDDIYFRLFLEKIEPHLGLTAPTILYDYPASQSALSNIHPEKPFWCKRFEVYMKGLEMGNAFDELTDASTQYQRFLEFQNEKIHLGKDVYPIDDDFINALYQGIPPSGGIAMGIDRIVMLLTEETEIRNIITFGIANCKISDF